MRKTVGILCLLVILVTAPVFSQTKETRAAIEQMSVLISEGKKDKADKLFNDILKNLPDNRNIIVTTANLLKGKQLNEYALEVLDKGAEINSEHDPFYLERASIYQAMNNYQESFELYLLDLENKPEHYATIKSRFQTLLLYDVNKSIAEEMRIALLTKNQQHPDNDDFALLLVWFSLYSEDYEMALVQCKSLDQRSNNQDGQIASIAQICYDNRQYETALDAYNYLVNKGKVNPYYGKAIIGAIKAENALCNEKGTTDRKTFERLSQRIEDSYNDIGSKEYPDLAAIQADIMAYHLEQSSAAIELLLHAIHLTQDKTQQCNLKLKLADIYLFNDEKWEATLLYSQVDKAMKEEPLGHEARYRNARLRYFIGEFAWAETQLNVLKAATSKLIANDAMTLSLIISDNLEYDTTGNELRRVARADYKIYQHKDEQAVLILDSICANGNDISKPHALCRLAEIKEKNRDYSHADSLYLRVTAEFPDSYMADDALMRAALIEDLQLNNKESAKRHYEQLIDQYPTSLYTAQAKKNFRKL